VRSKVPALFISGSLDGRTPISNAEEVRNGFANSAHLILEGASHGDDLFLSSPAILEAVLSFARNPDRVVRRVPVQ
jgi:pimeloyl-ACP methyl ester carboxylesterase